MPAVIPKRQILKNLSYISLGDLGSRLLAFAAFAYLARVLGPANLGLIGFGASAVALAAPLVDYGLGFVGTREVSKDPSTLKFYLKSVIFDRLILGTFAYGCLFVVTTLFLKDPEKVRILLLYGLTLLPAIVTLSWVYQGIDQTGWFTFEKITQSALYLAAIFLFVQRQSEFESVPVAYTLSALAPAFVVLGYYSRGRSPSMQKFSVRRSIGLLRSSLKLFVPTFLSQLSLSIGLLLVVFLGSLADAGYFSAASKIVILTAAIPNLLWSSFYPIVARTASLKVDGGKSVGAILYKYSILVGVVPLFFGLTHAHELVGILFGGSYEGSVAPFRLFSIVASLQCVSIVFTRILPALNMDVMFTRIVTVGAVIQVIACVALVPSFGVSGAALSYVFSEGTIVLFALREFRRINNINLVKIPAVALSVIAVCYALIRGVGTFIPLSGVPSIVAILGLYAVALWATGFISVNEFILSDSPDT